SGCTSHAIVIYRLARRLTFLTSKTTGPHDSNEIVLVVSCAEWQITTCEPSPASSILLRNVSTVEPTLFSCSIMILPASKKPNGSEEIDMDAPKGIVRTQISKILVYKMGRIGNNQIPLFRFRYVPKIVGAID